MEQQSQYILQKYDKTSLAWRRVSMRYTKDLAIRELDFRFFSNNDKDTSYRLIQNGKVIAQRIKDDLQQK
jgi:hypothetical protein